MNILNNKLSSMTAGSRIKLTLMNGRSIDGVVSENDGEQSLTVRVMSLVTLDYRQVCTVEEDLTAQTEVSQPHLTAAEQTADTAVSHSEAQGSVEEPRAAASPDQNPVAESFKAMETEEKKALAPANDKYLSFRKSHDQSKFDDAVDLTWKIISNNNWQYNPRVNRFYAELQREYGDYGNAADSFFYSGEPKTAALMAYKGAQSSRDKKLYSLAEAFSAIYLTGDGAECSPDIIDIFKNSCENAQDISGIRYLADKSADKAVCTAIRDIVKDLGSQRQKFFTDTAEFSSMLDGIQQFFPSSAAADEIRSLLENAQIDTPESAAEEKQTDTQDSPAAKEHQPDTTKVYKGRITDYKFLNEKGSITLEDGTKYAFSVKNINDKDIVKQLNKTGSQKISPISVEFKLMKFGTRYDAVNIKRSSEHPIVQAANGVSVDMTNARYWHTHGKYELAIQLYERCLDKKERPDAVAGIILCYLSIWNADSSIDWSGKIESFINENVNPSDRTTKVLEAIQQYYMKVHDFSNAISILNELIDRCGPAETTRMLHYLFGKSLCYRNLKDYPSAISQLLDWLDIVNKKMVKERFDMRNRTIYTELAGLYYEAGDLENAEKYAKLSTSEDKAGIILDKIAKAAATDLPGGNGSLSAAAYETDSKEISEDDDPYDEDEDKDEEDQGFSLEEAFAEYHDKSGFGELNISNDDINEKLSLFKADNLYCLLAYLSAAASLADEYNSSHTGAEALGEAFIAANAAFGYAFNSMLCQNTYMSDIVITVFQQAKSFIPEISDKLFAAASLYALFGNTASPDYHTSDLVIAVNGIAAEKYSGLSDAVGLLEEFRAGTGYGMDMFADYKTSSAAIDSIIEEARSCREAVDLKNESFESHGQVRRMREYLFMGEQSELRKCLDIVADNDVDRFEYVKNTAAELFIRENRPLEADNIDDKKIDKYIDRFWDIARDVILSEHRHISRPRDKIKGSKRNNIVIMTKRIISCICAWIAAAEHSGSNDNDFARSKYSELAPRVAESLKRLAVSCDSYENENGFDWGTHSIRLAAADLLAKLNGHYDQRERKYFFIRFLLGGDILLDDNYLPELRSTFCGIPGFDILTRIEQHAHTEHPGFAQRLTDIFSEQDSKHNLRSARLLKLYGEDMGLDEISGHKDLSQYNTCLQQAKNQLEGIYRSFTDELELCESYGSLSNVKGEKTDMQNITRVWYRITRASCDFGFFVRLLDALREKISDGAAQKGESLMRQLDELSAKTEYDFGVYPRETIAAHIQDCNYTTAEYMLNCIRRHDANSVADYSVEPFGFFRSFMSEHATNFRVTADSKISMEHSITNYVGKKNLELAMKQLTGNVMKDVRGGCGLVSCWISATPAREERVEKLLASLGFGVCTAKPDEGNQADSYIVTRKKQRGKINYPHPIPAFSSLAEDEGFRVLFLYGTFNCDRLMDMFHTVNTAAKHTVVFLDYALNLEERRRLARKIKEEKSFAKSFIVVDRVIALFLAKHYSANSVNKMLMAITMPFAYYQPFVESSAQIMPPELFTGRDEELTSIESAEGANLVYGGRQLGKSALLKMAQHNIDKNANGDRAVLVEIKDMDYTRAAQIVSSELIIAGILDENCRCDNWDILAEHIKKRLMDDDPETRINFLLLMLDEADEFIRTSVADDNRPITALKNLPSNRFKPVMAGLHNLSRYNREEMLHKNSTLIHFNSVIVRPFRRPEAVKLLTNTLAYLGFRFNEKIISLILAKTNYFPGLIQLYCQKLIEAMKSDDYAGYSESNTPPYEVTESHFKRVLSDEKFMEKVNEKLEITLFVEEKGHSSYHIIALILSFLCYSAPNEKGHTLEEILQAARDFSIARLINLKEEQVRELMHEMWDLNILSLEGDRYRFSTEGFREMLGNQNKVEQTMAEYISEGGKEE